MTKPDITQHELIQVVPPDYDRRFTYSLKIGDETVFDDGNKLGDNRFQLTDLISKINGKLVRLNNLEREFDGMTEALKAARTCLEIDCAITPTERGSINGPSDALALINAALKGRP